MAVHSPEFKEQLIRKSLPPHNQRMADLSHESGLHVNTLYKWKRQLIAQGVIVSTKKTHTGKWSSKAKLTALMQTAAMNEIERAAYCREHGLYPEQLAAWQAAFEEIDLDEVPVSKATLAAERRKTQQLERELRRKEKALAETAALLTLSKKARAIWGDNEEN